VFPLGACVPSRVHVPLCIFAGIPFLMVRLSPMPWARDGCVTVFNVEPARITHVVICELFDKIEQGRCWWIVTTGAGWLRDDLAVPAVLTCRLRVLGPVGRWQMAYGHFVRPCVLVRHVLRACSFLRVPLLLSFPLENLSPRPRMVGWPESQFVVKEARALVGRKVLEAVVLSTWLRSG
jgi:hypothetical protein